KKLALSASAGNLKNLEHIKVQANAKADRVKSDAEALRARIEALSYEERRQASEEGKLFGSVTSQDIADFLARHGVSIERRGIQLDEPIKTLGESAVPIRVHADVTAQLKVSIVREYPARGHVSAAPGDIVPGGRGCFVHSLSTARLDLSTAIPGASTDVSTGRRLRQDFLDRRPACRRRSGRMLLTCARPAP